MHVKNLMKNEDAYIISGINLLVIGCILDLPNCSMTISLLTKTEIEAFFDLSTSAS